MGESKVYDFTNDTVEVNNEAQTTGTEADVENNQTQEQNVDDKVDLSKNDRIDLSKNDNEQSNQQSYQQCDTQYQQYNKNQQYQQSYQQSYYQGYQQSQQNWQINREMVTPDKLALEPTTACLISCLLVGLGQMINGQIEKGLLILFGGMTIVFLIALVTCGFGAILSPLLIVISALDAYKCAKRLQAGQSIGKYEFHIFD